MFKLFFENEQNIQEKISKISDKEFTSSYQAFNDELIKFVLFNVDKCMKENNKELYLSFINKFISIIELNHKINSNKEDYELIYYNLSKSDKNHFQNMDAMIVGEIVDCESQN